MEIIFLLTATCKRRLEISCCLLVAALLNYSPSKYNKMAALKSPDTAIINAHLCLCATAEAKINLNSKNKGWVSSLLKTQISFWMLLNMQLLIGSSCHKKVPLRTDPSWCSHMALSFKNVPGLFRCSKLSGNPRNLGR